MSSSTRWTAGAAIALWATALVVGAAPAADAAPMYQACVTIPGDLRDQPAYGGDHIDSVHVSCQYHAICFDYSNGEGIWYLIGPGDRRGIYGDYPQHNVRIGGTPPPCIKS